VPSVIDRVKRKPAAAVAIAVQKRYGKDSGGYLAAVMTYYGFLSLFPLILLGLAVIGFVLAGDPAEQAEWADRLSGTVPGLGPLIGDNIDTIVRAREEAGLIALAGLLWTGTGIVEASGWVVGRVFRVPPHANFLKKKAWSIGSLIVLGTLSLTTTALAGAAGSIQLPGPLDLLLVPIGGVVAFTLDVLLFLVAYRILVQRRGPAFRYLWPGALLAAVFWFALKFLGSWYASRTLDSSSAVYGTFGAVVAVLVLLYLAARVFVYGAELNAVLIERRGGGPMGEAEKEREEREELQRSAEAEIAGNGRVKPPHEQSTVELIRSIAADTGSLVKKEVELARKEVTEAVTARIKGVAAMATAGVLGLIALVFLATAGAWALALVMPNWAAWLIVGGVFLLLAGGAVLFGKARMRSPTFSPEETKRTVKEDVAWAKQQLKR
jgi:membrane protein